MSAQNDLSFEKITPKTIPSFEPVVSGHRACQGCGEMLAMRLAMKAMGEDTIVVSATGCMEVVTTQFPQTAWNVPWLHVAFENAAAVGSGVEAAKKAMARKGRVSGDQAKILVMGGDGGTSDIGFQALSGAMERGHDLVYICFDNEAYMNTGIQRSSATPPGAWTTTSPLGECSTGKMGPKKDLPVIMANHKIPYVATASPGYHLDLMNKVRKAAATPGPAFVHVFSPCATGWRMPTKDTLKVSKLVVQTKMYPLYEVIHGEYKLSRKISKPKPVTDYFQLQGRFKHMSEAQVQAVQEDVDAAYAALEQLAAGSMK
ncbi:pyruvate synthase subunit PorB [Thermodesulfobacteriota bacterium]